MLSLTSPDGRVHVAVDDLCGARLASLRVDGVDLLVSEGDDALAWGCYPMVPYAGRVRNAVVTMHGSMHPLPAIAPPHALHGTVFATPWTVLDHSESRATLLTEFAPPWPVEGTVRHEIVVDDDSVTMRLDVHAHDDMPCQVGWHPWFVRPDSYSTLFRYMWPRDDQGIASPVPVAFGPVAAGSDQIDSRHATGGTYDDCFSEPTAPITLVYSDLEVTLDSDCSHWVVYDRPEHAICVEPQSGPPNQINDDPHWLGFGESLTRNFRIWWRNTRR